MEHDLWNGLRLRIPEGEVPLGADSLLLADFLTPVSYTHLTLPTKA